jgi:hypothetical protein
LPVDFAAFGFDLAAARGFLTAAKFPASDCARIVLDYLEAYINAFFQLILS